MTIVKRWDFLAAMKLGETYTLNNKLEPGKRTWQTKTYADVGTAVAAMHKLFQSFRWVVRSRDDKIDVVLVKTDMGEIPVPPSVNGRVAMPIGRASEEAIQRRKLRQRAYREPPAPLAQDLRQATIDETRKQAVAAVTRKKDTTEQEWLVKMVRAHAVGQPIQHQKSDGTWMDEAQPAFTDDAFAYRVKPEPLRELFAVLTRDGSAVVRVEMTRKALGHADPACVVHYREVLKEEEDET